MTLPALQQMKREGTKVVGVVVYDYQMARIVDRAGVDIVSVGDSIGMNIWGHSNELEVTLDQMALACAAVRRGVDRALVSCDLPIGSLRQSTDGVVRAAASLVENGADVVKVDAAAEFPDAVRAIARAGIAVWAQFGVGRVGPVGRRGLDTQDKSGAGKRDAEPARSPVDAAAEMKDELVAQATLLEEAGASLLDFTHSGPVAGPAVASAVTIPVIGGLGGGPWLDGRIRAVVNAIGYMAAALDDSTDRYANVARITLDAVATYAGDVRAARQIRGK